MERVEMDEGEMHRALPYTYHRFPFDGFNFAGVVAAALGLLAVLPTLLLTF